MSHVEDVAMMQRDIIMVQIGRYVRRHEAGSPVSLYAGVRHLRERSPFIDVADRSLGELIAKAAIRDKRNVSFDLEFVPAVAERVA